MALLTSLSPSWSEFFVIVRVVDDSRFIVPQAGRPSTIEIQCVAHA